MDYLSSVRAFEAAVGVKIPENARIIRNLLHGAQFQHDHIIHFYRLHALDWVDVVSALKADPAKTAVLSDNVTESPMGGTVYFKQVQQRLQSFVDSGQLGPLNNGYWGHPAYRLPPEAHLMAAAHYIEAPRLQARAARMHAIFGAKTPHLQALVVGGVTSIKDLSPERIYKFLDLWRETQDFVEKVTEDVIRAWNENGPARHPFNGETKPQHGDYEQDKGKYSWFKALRYEVEPCEVGPPARALVAYADGNEEFKEVIDGVLQKLDVPVEALFSTLGRTAARGIETLVIGQKMEGWIMDLVENIKNDDTKTYQPWEMPDKGMGYGLNDVARGALGHWIEIEDKKIKNYQYVVPSTWNLGPRCEKGKPGFLLEPRDSSVAVALSA